MLRWPTPPPPRLKLGEASDFVGSNFIDALGSGSFIGRDVWQARFQFSDFGNPGIFDALSTPPPLPEQPPSRTGRATYLGCGAAFVVGSVIVAIVLVILVQNVSSFFSSTKLNEEHNSVVGSAYVGEWVETANPNSFIQILPNGSANCQINHGATHFSVNGGHATFDKSTGRLAIKFFFFGPSWHVDEAPHLTTDGFQMKLDGSTYRRLRAYPSPSKSPGSGLSV